jgi:glycosyltransferase involved in cell wall biosynthesis
MVAAASPPIHRVAAAAPQVVVLSSLFPSAVQPGAGLFIRERMFRVGRRLPLRVVAPTPWFPLQSLLRRWRPGFRPGAPFHEQQDGHDVWFPRFLCVPGLFKSLDGWFMALAAWPRLRALRRAGQLDVIDAHFAYPDGFAAVQLGRWLGVPVTITMRGTESRLATHRQLGAQVRQALLGAARVFAVSESLRQVALGLGVPAERTEVVGNGVDLDKFSPLPQAQARAALGLPADMPVLVSVGGLVERKGFHRVIELLPALRQRWPGLLYLVVGGPSPEGDMGEALRQQVRSLGLQDAVRFLGPLPPRALPGPLSAADVFVLSTRNEGWANVFLEAMACGLPVVTTAVGGNAEVVCRPELGAVVPFGEPLQLQQAIDQALATHWDRDAICRHAQANRWDTRVDVLEARFRSLHSATAAAARPVRQQHG